MKPSRSPRFGGFATWRAALAALAAAFAPALHAIEIVIEEGWDSPTRIAVAPFAGPPLRDGPGPVAPVQVADIISFDLLRSGQFYALAEDLMLSHPSTPEEVHFRDWRVQNMDYLVIGTARQAASGDVTFVYHLFDVTAEREIHSSFVTVPSHAIRDAAHRISDAVYEQVTGVRGAFSTKILYVLAENAGTAQTVYQLKIADADGARATTVFRSDQPILSPSWAPDSRRVAYVTFETGRSTIVVQDLDTGRRQRVADYPGINGAPTFSPDGGRLAMSLSKDGNAEIYIKDLASGDLRRVTRRPFAIDTEPVWGLDGGSLIFTSDRGGSPRIYRKELATGVVERLTSAGDYNARPRLLPDGRHLIYVHRHSGVYHIAWQDLERDTVRVLTETALDESPSIAPNGTMMIYATQGQGRGILAVVSVDSRVKYILPSDAGDVREPAWSPFIDGLPGPIAAAASGGAAG